MALHWLNVYVSFGFWQLDQNPLDLNLFTKLGRARIFLKDVVFIVQCS